MRRVLEVRNVDWSEALHFSCYANSVQLNLSDETEV